MDNSKKQFELLKLGEKTSNKLFNSSKEKLICHPEALPAFEAWSAVKKHDLKHDAVPDHMKELYVRTANKVAVVTEEQSSTNNKQARQTLYFLNGFDTIQQIIHLDIVKLPMTAVSSPNPEAILQYSWFEVAKLMFLPLERRLGWVSYRDVINQHMPPLLINQFFGKDRITVEMLLQLSGMDKRAYERMRACYREIHPVVNRE